MHPSVIQFACGHCHAQLTVPVQMAGVSGPCPKCGQTIVSPLPAEPAAGMWGAPQMPAAPVSQPSPPAWAPPVSAPAPQPAPQRPMTQPLQPMAQSAGIMGFPPEPPGLPPFPQAASSTPVWNTPTPATSAPSWGASESEGSSLLSGGLFGNPASTSVRPTTQPLAGRTQLPPARGPGQTAPLSVAPPEPAPSNPQSRPMNVGGSRISLLARQLGNADMAGQPLPPVPEPLTSADLQLPVPASSPPTSALPRSRKDEVGAAMLQQNMRRGAGYSSAPRSRGQIKTALAALLFLTALGAVGYQFKDQLLDMLGQPALASLPPEEPEPPVLAPASSTAPTSTSFDPEAPAPASSTAPPLPVAPSVVAEPVPAKPVLPAPAPVVAAPLPEVKPAQPAPQVPGVAMPSTPDQIPLPTVATPAVPKALPVEPEPATEQVAALKTQPMHLPPPNPVVTQPSSQLVEIGRSPEGAASPSSMKGSAAEDLASSKQPEVRGAPDAVKPAVEGLLKFLNAPNWNERMKYTLHASKMEEKGTNYYQNNADGPIEVELIEYLRHDTSPQIGQGTHVVFVLSGRSWNYSFPVMVEQTADGAFVDWLTFVEFKDDLLRHYLASDLENVWSFHVELRRTHYFEDDVANSDKMDCFEIMSVMGTAHAFAFVPKDSPLARSLANTITWDKEVSYVVANLQYRNTAEGKWLELVGVPQLNWYTAPEEQDATAKEKAVPAAKQQ
jgi:hypothetical protein